MANPTSPNDLTRQQLDELDTLLQRMLSLPLNKPDAVPVPPKVELPLPPAPPTLSAAEMPRPPLPEPPAAWSAPLPEPRQTFLPLTPAAPVDFEPATDVAPRGPDLRSLHDLLPFPIPGDPSLMPGGPGTLRGVDAPATPAGFRSAMPPIDLPPALPAPSPGPVMTPPPPPSSGPGLLAPLVLANRVLEGTLGWCGPLGHWLTRPPVKRLLGYAGLVMLVASGWWVARGMGWVSWPD
jgi:hypothetical protein